MIDDPNNGMGQNTSRPDTWLAPQQVTSLHGNAIRIAFSPSRDRLLLLTEGEDVPAHYIRIDKTA